MQTAKSLETTSSHFLNGGCGPVCLMVSKQNALISWWWYHLGCNPSRGNPHFRLNVWGLIFSFDLVDLLFCTPYSNQILRHSYAPILSRCCLQNKNWFKHFLFAFFMQQHIETAVFFLHVIIVSLSFLPWFGFLCTWKDFRCIFFVNMKCTWECQFVVISMHKSFNLNYISNKNGLS